MLQLIFILVLVGFGLYLLQIAPLDATIKLIIRCLVIFLVIIWVFSFFGAFGPTWGHFGGLPGPCR